MLLTRHDHACITLEHDGAVLLVDPGVHTAGVPAALARADAVLVTHEHPDHVHVAALAAALDARPELRVHGPEFLLRALDGRTGQVVVVAPGDRLDVAGVPVTVHGGTHAPIHPDVPGCDNVGYLFDGRLLHPGDAYAVPAVPVETLLVPTSGPWARLGDAVDFVRAVRPARSVPVHDGMLSDLGRASAARFLGADGLTGVPYLDLAPGDTLEV